MKNFLMACFLVLAGCSVDKNTCGSESVKATIEDFTGLDGCGWVIVLKDGSRLEPVNLSGQKVTPADGKKVWLTYTKANNSASICMVGEMINITCMCER